MGKSSVTKGAAFERELARYFEEHCGIPVRRSVLTTQIFSRKGNSDLVGPPGLAIEAKRVEALNFRTALAQARRNANRDEVAIVINRRNRESTDDAVVALTLSDFLTLYRKALVASGHLPPFEDKT